MNIISIKRITVLCVGVCLVADGVMASDSVVAGAGRGASGAVIDISCIELFFAIEANDPEEVARVLSDESIDINAKDSRGKTPLLIACESRPQMALLLLDDPRVGVNIPDRFATTPLSAAVANLHVEVVEKLLKRDDINVNVQDDRGRTPLATAIIWKGDPNKVVKSFIIAQMLRNHPSIDTKIIVDAENRYTAFEKLDTQELFFLGFGFYDFEKYEEGFGLYKEFMKELIIYGVVTDPRLKLKKILDQFEDLLKDGIELSARVEFMATM